MNRPAPIHRTENKYLYLALRRKLRLKIWKAKKTAPLYICVEIFYTVGDHPLQCTNFIKSVPSNKIRDVCWRVFGNIFKPCHFIEHEKDMEKEAKGIIRHLPNLWPYDWSVPVNILLSAKLSRATPLSRIGVEVTIIYPSIPSQLIKNAPLQKCYSAFATRWKGKVFETAWHNKQINQFHSFRWPNYRKNDHSKRGTTTNGSQSMGTTGRKF